MKLIIDRLEGEFAVCEREDGTMLNIPKDKIPKHAHEGDVLNVENNKITMDEEETRKRKEEIEELIRDMWN